MIVKACRWYANVPMSVSFLTEFCDGRSCTVCQVPCVPRLGFWRVAVVGVNQHGIVRTAEPAGAL
jgi:hypothetical protein